MMDRIRIVPSLLVALMVLTPVKTFVQPFGIRNSHHQQCLPFIMGEGHISSVPARATINRLPLVSSSSSLWAKAAKPAAKADEEDEDWEPTEEDLISNLEDLSLDEAVDEVEIVDDSMVMIADDDDEVVVAVDEDEEDDDDDDADLDVWAEDGEDEIVEELDGEWEGEEDEAPASYLGSEADYEDEEWDEDEGNTDIPLMDDPDDPDYMAQKKLVEETVARREQLKEDKDFEPLDFIMNRMTQEMADALEGEPLIQAAQEIEDEMVVLDAGDFEGMNLMEEMAKTSDLMNDDPYENEGRENLFNAGIDDDDMEELDTAYKRIQHNLAEEPWNKVDYKVEITDFHSLPNETIQEMDACLDEIAGSSYNCTRWLLYDLDFNVSNLILAAVKHNPKAPVIFQHWFPQLVTYSRYEHTRERNFDFDWDDVANADVDELERYYMGFGYQEIPTKAPSETGIIGFEDLDEEELKMAAFENWMIEVYNPEWDRKDFDDDKFQDEDNVFSHFHEEPQHPDLPSYDDVQDDIRNWEEDMDEEEEDNQEYKDFMAKEFKYDFVEDKDFKDEFRGHLIVACSPDDDDVAIAEKITGRMGEEFGKQIYVETRVMAHAREEDNVFEVWLESYEVDLLHSKKRAVGNTEGWTGPAECDDEEIEHIVEEVRELISDDARYSYRYHLDKELAA
jgi:hypothetical protein